MPYIKQSDRKKWEDTIEDIVLKIEDLPIEQVDGNLNYLITAVLKAVYPQGYYHYNRAVGMLECCKLELYRRVIAPYEDSKETQNGPV